MMLEFHYLVLNNHFKCLEVLINGYKNYLRITSGLLADIILGKLQVAIFISL